MRLKKPNFIKIRNQFYPKTYSICNTFTFVRLSKYNLTDFQSITSIAKNNKLFIQTKTPAFQVPIISQFSNLVKSNKPFSHLLSSTIMLLLG